MITEDYVSFDTAKLLKAKGFDELTYACFSNDGKETYYGYRAVGNDINRPTLQMAMKWLREIDNIHIEVKYFFEPHIYKYTITYTPVALDNISSHPQCFNTYEEACEAAIRYTLENLI